MSYGHVFSILVLGALALGGPAQAQPAVGVGQSRTIAQAGEQAPPEPVDARPGPMEPTDAEPGNFVPDVAPDMAPDSDPDSEPFVDPEAWYLQEAPSRHPIPVPREEQATPHDEETAGNVPPLPERKNLASAAQPSNMPAQLSNPLSRMIGQMLMVGFNATSPDEGWAQRLAGQIRASLVGGVVFMEHNIKSSGQVSRLASMLQEAARDPTKTSRLPVLIAVDQEGGVVQRLAREKGFHAYPSADELGRSNDPHKAYLTYKDMADELVANGFNVNLGPVVDLNRNPASPTIAGKARSYSADPQRVIAYAKAFCYAHRDAGVLTVLKHFPGHGSSAGDSHVDFVDLSATWTEAELEPYRLMVRERVGDAIMVGHVYHPEFSDGKRAPASLSAMAIQKQLRGRLGYGGVVITDDLDMGAIRKAYGFEESLVRAIEGGADILLLTRGKEASPEMPERAVAVIRQAVVSGRLSEDRIRASYERVISLKRRLAKLEKDRSRKQQVSVAAPASPLRSSPPASPPGPAAAPAPASGPGSHAQAPAGAPPASAAPAATGSSSAAPSSAAAAARAAARRERETRRDDNFPF